MRKSVVGLSNQEWLAEMKPESISMVNFNGYGFGKQTGLKNCLRHVPRTCIKRLLICKKSLNKHKDHVFKFLFDPGIPYDNNASERAVRPLKVKQKVSGSFRNPDGKGADTFCQIHSITQTAKKNDQNPFSAILTVANNY